MAFPCSVYLNPAVTQAGRPESATYEGEGLAFPVAQVNVPYPAHAHFNINHRRNQRIAMPAGKVNSLL
jgi:hypothetical protein